MNDTIRDDIIDSCNCLIPFADSCAKALACEDVKQLLRLFSGESQKRTLRRLSNLINALGRCRTVDDLPGPSEVVCELRETSFEVFRGLSELAGNPFGLTARFRSQAVVFFSGLLSRDPLLLARVKKRRERETALTLLTCAFKAMAVLLRGISLPLTLLGQLGIADPVRALRRTVPAKTRKRRHVEDGEWMLIERQNVIRFANDASKNPKRKLPHELALSVWRTNEIDFTAAAHYPAKQRGYKDAKSLRAHFYPLRQFFQTQLEAAQPFAEPTP